MSPEDTPPAKTATTTTTTKDHENNQQGSGSGGGGGRKSSSSTTATRPQEHGIKCPRCDSPNTKFCYYNNYSLTQPRHFCKTCRRYWTKGGALRNVPIGGGCRKKNKVKSSRMSCDSNNSGGGSSSSDQFNGLKFLHGLSSSPSVDFHHLAGLPFPRLQLHHQVTTPIYNNNHFSSFAETSSAPPFDPSSVAMNYPFPSGYNGANAMNMNMNIHSHNNLASSIESLSSMNQDLHWKLQQQRLAMLFGGENQKENNNSVVSEVNENNESQKPQPILFQNLEVTKAGGEVFSVGNSRKSSEDTILPSEWFFGNSYGSSVTTTPTPTTASSGGPGPVHDNNATNWNGSGVHAWGDVQQQYSSLP